MIRDEFWEDEKVGMIEPCARLLFIHTWAAADDFGVVRWNAGFLRAGAFRFDKFSDKSVRRWMLQLESKSFVKPFETDSHEIYALIPRFLLHQKISHPSRKRNPKPPDSILKGLAEKDSGIFQSTLEKNGKTLENISPKSNQIKSKLRSPLTPPQGGMDVIWVIDLYLEMLSPPLPGIVVRNEELFRTIRARLSEVPEGTEHEAFVREVFAKVKASRTLIHGFAGDGGRTWKCPGLRWIIGPRNWAKIIEGFYDVKRPSFLPGSAGFGKDEGVQEDWSNFGKDESWKKAK